MPSQANALLERFFTAAISGDRAAARAVLDECFDADATGERVASHLIWPTLHQIQTLRRSDQLASLAYHYATRLLRSVTDQLQLRYEQHARRDQSILVMSGTEETEEITGQLAAELLEA
ncbi:MAG: B12-binding domain-containing protein, partial [Planctomycetota bacterium]